MNPTSNTSYTAQKNTITPTTSHYEPLRATTSHYEPLRAKLTAFCSLLLILMLSFNLSAQVHLGLTTDLERSNGLVAWKAPTDSIGNAVDHYLLEIFAYDETNHAFDLIESFRLTQEFAVFPENYRNGQDIHYRVVGVNGMGVDILHSDILPACPTCNWEVTRTWSCYGRDFAYTIKENTKQNNNNVYYSVGSLTALTQSGFAEFYNNDQNNMALGMPFPYPTPAYPGPFFNKTGTALSPTVYGRKLPKGPNPNNGNWGPAEITTVLPSSGAVGPHGTLQDAILKFNQNRAYPSSNQIPLNCNVQYPGGGTGGGIVRDPIGDLGSNPLTVKNHPKIKLACFKHIQVYSGTDENGNPIYQWVTIKVDCEGLNPINPGINANSSLDEVVRALAGENDSYSSDALVYNNLESISIKQISGAVNPFSIELDSTDLFDNTGNFIYSNSNAQLLPGVYQAATIYSDSLYGVVTFLVPDEDLVPLPGFTTTIYPVPNDGNYELKITSEELKQFRYEVYDATGTFYYDEPVQIFEYATEVIIPMHLNISTTPAYNQLIHRITDENNQIQIIQTIYNGN